MKKINLLPNIITAFGLSCGLYVIFKIVMTGSEGVNHEWLMQLTGLLLIAALADLLDGAVARAIKAESEFGGFFDSMADSISFGVAPALIVLKSLSTLPETELTFFVTAGAMVYALCGILRLVRFNVIDQQVKEDSEPHAPNKKNFTGLPIPASAAALVSANLFLFSKESTWFFTMSEETRAVSLVIVMLILGYFMVSRWKFPSVKRLEMRVASFQIVVLTVLSAVFILYGIVNHFPLVFFIFSWGYVVTSWVLSVVRLIAGRKSKTLEDFEPDENDL